MELLADKTLIMIVGPTAIGKSTLMNEVARIDNRFGRVRSFTTRPPRPNDEPSQYFYFTPEQLQTYHADKTIITDVEYPTTGHHYGTIAKSYSSDFCMLDTLAHSVQQYRELPFARTITVSLTTDADSWVAWLDRRFPNGGDEKYRRLKEAVLSMEWSVSQTNNHYWLINRPEHIEQTAHDLITLVTTGHGIDQPPDQALSLLNTARSLLSYQ